MKVEETANGMIAEARFQLPNEIRGVVHGD
jgi:hypothetical protein